MITYAPNIGWLFPDLPFAERPRAVFEAGFDALEFGFYGQADLHALEAARTQYGLEIVLMNMDVPEWGGRNLGYLADPERRCDFKRALDESLEIATRLGILKLMVPAGARLPRLCRERQIESVIENLCAAAPLAEQAGVVLTIEALNSSDVPGYFLNSSALGVDIVRQVDHPCVKFQFDTYHLHILEGDPIPTLIACMDAIGHIQFADSPGRTEPGKGTLDFDGIVRAAEESGYEGYIGLEYIPCHKGLRALAWVPVERRFRR